MSDSVKKYMEMSNEQIINDLKFASTSSYDLEGKKKFGYKSMPTTFPSDEDLDRRRAEIIALGAEPTQKQKPERAKRFNKGKTRHALIPPNFKEALADVYTKGAHKYSIYMDKSGNKIKGEYIPHKDVGNYELIEDASDNWRKGQTWMECMDSVMRHIEAWKSGEDFDQELGTYHLANAAWGLASLVEFYSIFPEGDNRPHAYLTDKKIGLDIDEVLADWVGGWMKLHGLTERPINWHFRKDILQEFEDMKKSGTLEDFYMNLEPLVSPNDIHFEPDCYITSRPVSSEVTTKWLLKNGFSTRPVLTTEPGKDKVYYAKQRGLDIFVDDNWNNFLSLSKAGICCYLIDAPHNKRYDVGFKRIDNLNKLPV